MRVGDYTFTVRIFKHNVIAKIHRFGRVVDHYSITDTTDLETPFIWGVEFFKKSLSAKHFDAFDKVASPLFEQLQDLMVGKASV